MTNIEKHKELKEKLLFGLEKAYEKLIEFKRQKKTELVILKGNEVIKVKP
jgi:hypothetical protein